MTQRSAYEDEMTRLLGRMIEIWSSMRGRQDDMAGRFASLEQRMAAVEEALKRPRMNGERDATELEQIISGLRRDLVRQATELNAVRTALATVSQAVTASRKDLTEGGEIKQQAVGKLYDSFVTQSLIHGATQSIAKVGARGDDHQQFALRVCILAKQLLSPELQDRTYGQVRAELADQNLILDLADVKQLVNEAKQLIEQARAAGFKYQFEFDVELEIELDPVRQSPWEGCPSDGLADFVVTPAYVYTANSGEKVIRKQQVYTVPAPTPAVADLAEPRIPHQHQAPANDHDEPSAHARTDDARARRAHD